MSIKLSWAQRFKAFLTGKLHLSAKKNDHNQPSTAPKTKEQEQSAKQLLAILQQQGRFVDFIYTNIDHYSDAQISAAARILHQGCQKALKRHCKINAIRSEIEGDTIVLEHQFDRHSIHLTGNIQNQDNFRGNLIHKGWKIDDLALPVLSDNANPNIIQPAEIEVL